MSAMPRQTMVGWVLAGGIAVAAMAIGYGLGRSGDAKPGEPAEPAAEAGYAYDDGDVGGPLGGDEATPPVVRETTPAPPPAVSRRSGASAPVLQPGQRVEVDVAPGAYDQPPAALQPELVSDSADSADSDRSAGAAEVITLAAGTPLRIRLVEGLSSQTSQVGDAVHGELSEPLVVDGRAVFPAGTPVQGEVVEVQPLRKIGGRAHIAFVFDRLVAGEQGVPIEAAWSRVGKSETGKDAATIAGGAAAGAVLGNQAKKNDRGKILGGLLGAGVGAAIASKTEGERIELPAGTVLEVSLADAVVATVDR